METSGVVVDLKDASKGLTSEYGGVTNYQGFENGTSAVVEDAAPVYLNESLRRLQAENPDKEVNLMDLEDYRKIGSDNPHFSTAAVELNWPEYRRRYFQALSLMGAMLVGNMLEWYEFALYGYLEEHLKDEFFAGSSVWVWVVFGITFVCRPVGGVLFGELGDALGRKQAALIAVAVMALSTSLTAFLPSLHFGGQTGEAVGCVLLVIIRVVQGLATGGEVGGVLVYAMEQKDRVVTGGIFGAVNASGSLAFASACAVILVLEVHLTDDEMARWGWRLPYLLVIPPSIAAVWGIWAKSEETEEFQQMKLEREAALLRDASGSEAAAAEAPAPSASKPKQAGGDEGAPILAASAPAPSAKKKVVKMAEIRAAKDHMPKILQVLEEHGFAILLLVGCIMGLAQFWYSGAIYTVSYIKQRGASDNVGTSVALIAQLVSSVSVIFMGVLNDAIGSWTQCTIGMVVLVLSGIPSYYIVAVNADKYWVCMLVVGLWYGFAISIASVPVSILACDLFPTKVRQTCVGFSFNLAVMIGGLGPLTCTLLVMASRYAPGYLLSGCALASLLCLVYLRRLGASGMLKISHLRKGLY